MALPMPNRQLRVAAAALGITLVASLGGFLAGRTGRSGAADAQPATTRPALAAQAAGHDHQRAAAPRTVGGPSTGVKIKRDWVTADGNRFSIWVAFGPPQGGGTMCAIGGSAGYTRGMVIMVRSHPANKPGRAPMLGTKGGRVAFSFGEYACTWNISNSAATPFKPGETRSIIGLVEPAKDPRADKLVLTVVRPGKPLHELATISYASMFSSTTRP
jgi:hypothetical protein